MLGGRGRCRPQKGSADKFDKPTKAISAIPIIPTVPRRPKTSQVDHDMWRWSRYLSDADPDWQNLIGHADPWLKSPHVKKCKASDIIIQSESCQLRCLN